MVFDAILPSDLTIKTFVRMEISDQQNIGSKTYIMFKSTADYSELAQKEHFSLSFQMESTGETSVKNFLKYNDGK
jgi:hypothetical protein